MFEYNFQINLLLGNNSTIILKLINKKCFTLINIIILIRIYRSLTIFSNPKSIFNIENAVFDVVAKKCTIIIFFTLVENAGTKQKYNYVPMYNSTSCRQCIFTLHSHKNNEMKRRLTILLSPRFLIEYFLGEVCTI